MSDIQYFGHPLRTITAALPLSLKVEIFAQEFKSRFVIGWPMSLMTRLMPALVSILFITPDRSRLQKRAGGAPGIYHLKNVYHEHKI